MPAKARTIDEYLSAVTDDRQRAALEKLRATIRSAVPEAEECISYGLAGFRLEGRLLVAFGAAKTHCAFYPASGTIVESFREALAGFDTSKGTIRFQPERLLSVALIRRILKARIVENASRNAASRRR